MSNLVALGIDPMDEKLQLREAARAPSLNTFGDVANAYLASMEGQRSKKRQIQETRFLNSYVLPVIGQRKLSELSTLDIEVLINKIKQDVGTRRRRKGATGKTTANACHHSIKRVFRWALKKKICTENIADFNVLFPMAPVKRIDRLNEERFALFWNAAVTAFQRAWGGRRSGVLSQLLFMATLQRPIDVARAKREHFDFEARMWTIPEDYTKTGAAYYIPLTDLTIMLVKRAMALQKGTFLFPSSRAITGHIDESSMSQIWRRHLDSLRSAGKIGNIDIELYDSRRFGRTQIRHKLKFPQEVAEAVINHAPSSEMATRYDVFDVGPAVRQAHERWAQEIFEMTGMRLDALAED